MLRLGSSIPNIAQSQSKSGQLRELFVVKMAFLIAILDKTRQLLDSVYAEM